MWSTKASDLQTRGNSNAYGQIKFCRGDLQLGPRVQAAENAEKEENIPTHPGSRENLSLGKRESPTSQPHNKEPPWEAARESRKHVSQRGSGNEVQPQWETGLGPQCSLPVCSING